MKKNIYKDGEKQTPFIPLISPANPGFRKDSSGNIMRLKKETGETAECPNCGQFHTVEYGEEIIHKYGVEVERRPSTMLAYVKCDDSKPYLVAVGGALLHNPKTQEKKHDVNT